MKEVPPNKKLVLIYLANEITQTSKMRKKEEFLRAYEPILAEGTTVAYKGSPHEIQNKIRRVVEVWRQRNIFNQAVQQAVERSIDDVDRTKSTRKPALGGSLFSSSTVPPELTPVAPLATTLQKADLATKPAVTAANQDYEKLTNPNAAIPSPPMHAAGLAALCKKLALAEGAVAESIKARKALITGLEQLLETNKRKLVDEEAQEADLKTRKDAIESRKRAVEEAILKGLSAAEQNRISTAPLPVATTSPVAATFSAAQERPEVEELTPPPMESFTPVGSQKRPRTGHPRRRNASTRCSPCRARDCPCARASHNPARVCNRNWRAEPAPSRRPPQEPATRATRCRRWCLWPASV